MNKLFLLFAGLFLANISYAAEPIKIYDDGVKRAIYVLPDTLTPRSIWVQHKKYRRKGDSGDKLQILDILYQVNCRHRYIEYKWFKVTNFNGDVVFNGEKKVPTDPVVPGSLDEEIFDYVCNGRR